jgi:hypothetical protein
VEVSGDPLDPLRRSTMYSRQIQIQEERDPREGYVLT